MLKQEKKLDLAKDSLKVIFWKYTLPSIAMMLIMSVYFIVDGMFVGRGIGSDALAAVNLCIPLMMMFNSVTMALAIGASIVISIRLGRKEYAQANNVFSLLFTLNMTLSLIMMCGGIFFSEELAYLLGANADTLEYVQKYLSIMLYAVPFFTLQNTLSSVVRNDGNPNLSLIASVSSSLVNIPLDYVLIFVFGWGITGAAVATACSQILASLILFSHLLFKKGHLRFVMPTFDAPLFKQKIRNSGPIFISNLSMPAILLTMNLLSKKYFGTQGLSAYAITGNIAMFVMMIFLGIAQGIQPIISYNQGIKDWNRIYATLKMGLFYALLFSLSLIAIIATFPHFFIGFYVTDNPELASLVVKTLRIYLLGFPFMGANLIMISFFQSIENNRAALSISAMRTFVVLVLVASFLPIFMGDFAAWFVVPLTEMIVLTGIGIRFYLFRPLLTHS